MKHNAQTLVTTMTMTLLLLVTSSRGATTLDELCPTICAEPQFYSSLLPSTYIHCDCAQPFRVDTTPKPTTTTDVCDYLCSIQLGGQACECSRPSLPGRK